MQTLRRNLLYLLILSLLFVGCTQPPRPTISLYRAVHAGDLDQIKRHIHWGTDLNQTDPNGETPLHVAARNGRVAITRLLLKHGADLEASNAEGHSPLHVALMSGRTQVAELLLKKGATLDANQLLHQVAINGVADRDVIALLIREGADVNSRNPSGNTPLHIAIQNGYRVVAKHLINQGADVNAINDANQTPLQLAIQADNQTLVKLLKNNGAVLR